MESFTKSLPLLLALFFRIILVLLFAKTSGYVTNENLDLKEKL